MKQEGGGGWRRRENTQKLLLLSWSSKLVQHVFMFFIGIETLAEFRNGVISPSFGKLGHDLALELVFCFCHTWILFIFSFPRGGGGWKSFEQI